MKRNVALGLLAVVLLAGAAILWLRGGVEDAAPADQFIAFRCTSCGNSYKLSHRDFEQVWNRNEYERKARELRFKCPKCGQMSAERDAEAGAGAESASRDAGG